MKYIKQFFRTIKLIDVAIVVILLIALGLAGYVQMEKTKEMGDTSVLYTVEEYKAK
ncbi:MAG: hypothetical protein ACI4E3_09845 [Candidatus Fimousia sp.]